MAWLESVYFVPTTFKQLDLKQFAQVRASFLLSIFERYA